MDIKRITLIEKENKSFIRYSLAPEEMVSKIELEMLKNNRIQGILDISEIQDDNETVFLYNVTSKIQLSQRFTMPFSGEQVYKMLQSLCRLWMCTDEYMLDRKHFIAYPELMCIDQETSEMYVMVLPIYTENDEEIEFRRILVGILDSLSYMDMEMQNFPSLLMEYIQNNMQLTANDFLDVLEKTYQAEQGVLQPISTAPDIPEHHRVQDGKEIVHEEMAKEMLRMRFQAQNDEVKLLNQPLKGEEMGNQLIPPAPYDINKKKTEKRSTSAMNIPSFKKENNQTGFFLPTGEKKTKPPKEKKKKEKERKSRNKETEGMNIAPPVPEKEEKQVKEKKGLFRGFGFGKKKGVTEERPPEEVVDPVPITDINEKRASIGGNVKSQIPQNGSGGNYADPVGSDMNAWQGTPQKIPSYGRQVYPAWSLNSEISIKKNNQNQNNGSVPSKDIQRETGGVILTDEKKIPAPSKDIQGEIQQKDSPQRIPPVQNISIHSEVHSSEVHSSEIHASEIHSEISVQEKELDLDATTLLDGSIDLDATTLMNPEKKKEISISVLRSRETGELITITHSGFLVGRQKMRNGKVVNLPGVRQPDLILAVNNVSHSHAEFVEREEQWYLLDHNSLNGTYVNEEKLAPQQEKALQEGDILRFASEEYEYLIMRE